MSSIFSCDWYGFSGKYYLLELIIQGFESIQKDSLTSSFNED